MKKYILFVVVVFGLLFVGSILLFGEFFFVGFVYVKGGNGGGNGGGYGGGKGGSYGGNFGGNFGGYFSKGYGLVIFGIVSFCDSCGLLQVSVIFVIIFGDYNSKGLSNVIGFLIKNDC